MIYLEPCINNPWQVWTEKSKGGDIHVFVRCSDTDKRYDYDFKTFLSKKDIIVDLIHLDHSGFVVSRLRETFDKIVRDAWSRRR